MSHINDHFSHLPVQCSSLDDPISAACCSDCSSRAACQCMHIRCLMRYPCIAPYSNRSLFCPLPSDATVHWQTADRLTPASTRAVLNSRPTSVSFIREPHASPAVPRSQMVTVSAKHGCGAILYQMLSRRDDQRICRKILGRGVLITVDFTPSDILFISYRRRRG